MSAFFGFLLMLLGAYLIARGVSAIRAAPLLRERNAQAELIDRIDQLAFDNRDVSPELATQVLDEVRSYHHARDATATPGAHIARMRHLRRSRRRRARSIGG